MKNKLKEFFSDLKRCPNRKVSFKKGKLEIELETEELSCAPDEIGTGVMEDFSETYHWTIGLGKMSKCISANN